MQDVEKVFLTDEVETHALADIHLAVKKNEWVAIVGPRARARRRCSPSSACSTPPPAGSTSSTASRCGTSRRPTARTCATAHIGFIFQSFNLIGDLTVYENVELPLTYRGMPPAERKKRVEDALERVGMSHRARHMPGQLSGGQQQRVAVARAVAGDPLILLADEPTGNLDSKNGQAVMKLFRAAPGRLDADHGDARPRVRAARHPHRLALRRAHRRGVGNCRGLTALARGASMDTLLKDSRFYRCN